MRLSNALSDLPQRSHAGLLSPLRNSINHSHIQSLAHAYTPISVTQRTYDPGMDEQRLPTTGALIGIALAAIGLLFAAATDGPYLTTDDVNGWILVFAAGLFGALIAVPFMLERRLRRSVDDRDKRWERALLGWGAIAIGVLFAGGDARPRQRLRRARGSAARSAW